jgi:hypothetical protein
MVKYAVFLVLLIALAIFLLVPRVPPAGNSVTPAASSGPTETEASSYGGIAAALYNDDAKRQAWIAKSEDALRKKLRDPDSVQFRNVHFYTSSGTPAACGEVSSRNTPGGGTGFERFIATGDDTQVLESAITDHDISKLWEQFCH